MIAYLDTHVVVWLCENKIQKLTGRALDAINDHDLLISPAVLIELNFLLQIGRIIRTPLRTSGSSSTTRTWITTPLRRAAALLLRRTRRSACVP